MEATVKKYQSNWCQPTESIVVLNIRKRQPEAYISWSKCEKTTARSTHQLTSIWENDSQKYTPAHLNMRKRQPEVHTSSPKYVKTTARSTHQLT